MFIINGKWYPITVQVKEETNVIKKVYTQNRFFSQDVLLQNIHDFDLKMTNSGENSQRCVTNDIEVPSLVQENHLQRDVHVYENDSDPYLNPETNEVELEYHQYLTVV